MSVSSIADQQADHLRKERKRDRRLPVRVNGSPAPLLRETGIPNVRILLFVGLLGLFVFALPAVEEGPNALVPSHVRFTNASQKPKVTEILSDPGTRKVTGRHSRNS